jgi:hypothetical protein
MYPTQCRERCVPNWKTTSGRPPERVAASLTAFCSNSKSIRMRGRLSIFTHSENTPLASSRPMSPRCCPRCTCEARLLWCYPGFSLWRRRACRTTGNAGCRYAHCPGCDLWCLRRAAAGRHRRLGPCMTARGAALQVEIAPWGLTHDLPIADDEGGLHCFQLARFQASPDQNPRSRLPLRMWLQHWEPGLL